MAGKIARTRAEAAVGDFLWIWDGNARKPERVWRLEPVQRRGRQYVFTGPPDSDARRWQGYDFELGGAQEKNGHAPYERAYGSHERQDHEWKGKGPAMARVLERTTDIEMLRAVGHILGIETPTLHDTIPEEVTA